MAGFHVGGINGDVYVFIEYGGELVAGGEFATAGDKLVNNIATWDGHRWNALGNGLSGRVSALAVHGSWLVAVVSETWLGDNLDLGIWVWDQTDWRRLGWTSRCACLLSFKGELYAGGIEGGIDGIDVGGIARYDGTGWHPLSATPVPGVRCLAVYDRQLVAGGSFQTLDGTSARYIATWNGLEWSALGDSPPVEVYGLIGADNGLYVTGGTAWERNPGSVFVWRGQSWQCLDGPGYHLATDPVLHDDDLIVVHRVYDDMEYRVYNSIQQYRNGVWETILPSGTTSIGDLRSWEGHLYCGGSFHYLEGTAVNSVAKWAGGTWLPLDTGGGGAGGPVSAMSVSNDRVYVAGNFPQVGPLACNSGATWDGHSWTATTAPGGGLVGIEIYASGRVPSGAHRIAGMVSRTYYTAPDCAEASWVYGSPSLRTTSSGVYCALPFAGQLALGLGQCDSVPLVQLNYPGQTGLGPPWGAGEVRTLALHEGQLFAGGKFALVPNGAVGTLAYWDGSAWHQVPDTPFDVVCALVSFEGGLAAAGGDLYYHPLLAYWDEESWHSLGSWGPSLVCGANDRMALTGYRGDLIFGGDFSEVDGTAANSIARWNGSVWNSMGSGIHGAVRALAVLDDCLYVGGDFSRAGDKAAANFACWSDALVPVTLAGLIAERRGTGARVTWRMLDDSHDVQLTVWRSVGRSARVLVGKASGEIDGLGSFDDATAPVTEADYWLCDLAGGGETWHGPAHLAALPVPDAVVLAPPRPNPFNPGTAFAFALSRAGRVRLTVHDTRGRLVARLLDGHMPAGWHDREWDGRGGDGAAAPSGVYFARLATEEATRTVKMVLAR
jgi:hypothetical protein